MTRTSSSTAHGRTAVRRRTLRRRADAGLLAAALVASVSACGGSTPRGLAPATHTSGQATPTGPSSPGQTGRQVFMSAGCASCHTHATGTLGPNLDRLKPSVAAIAAQVAHGGGGIPSFAGQLSNAQIEAFARFVATVPTTAADSGPCAPICY